VGRGRAGVESAPRLLLSGARTFGYGCGATWAVEPESFSNSAS
jgi:hypothetical protein